MVAAKKILALENTKKYNINKMKKKKQHFFRKTSYYFYYLKQLELLTYLLVDSNKKNCNRNLKLINALDNNSQSQIKRLRYLVRHNVKKPR